MKLIDTLLDLFPEKPKKTVDIGFLCNCTWEPGHDCAEAREPTNAKDQSK